MLRKTAFLFLIALLLSACAGNPMDGSGDLLPIIETQDQATKLGSPGEEVPDPIVKYLGEHRNWQGSYGADGEAVDNNLFMDLDIETFTATIFSLKENKTYTTMFKITDDGKIVSSGDDVLMDISAATREDSKAYPLDVKLVNSKGGYSARMFASSVAEDGYGKKYADRIATCNASASRGLDSDADLVGDGAYFVAGFVVTHNEGGEQCALTVFDTCEEEGVSLNEAVLDADAVQGFSVKKVECDCHNGRCMDEANDRPMIVTAGAANCDTGAQTLICRLTEKINATLINKSLLNSGRKPTLNMPYTTILDANASFTNNSSKDATARGSSAERIDDIIKRK